MPHAPLPRGAVLIMLAKIVLEVWIHNGFPCVAAICPDLMVLEMNALLRADG
jgi:hypothetical protein